jgi:hypothetical protein
MNLYDSALLANSLAFIARNRKRFRNLGKQKSIVSQSALCYSPTQ